MPVVVDKDLCVGCGTCVNLCPAQAMKFDEDGKAVCDAASCVDCGTCIENCPMSAIRRED